MAKKSYTPVLVGVADFKNASTKIEDAVEPLKLILKASHLALQDTSLPPSSLSTLQASIDSVSVVAPWSWNYYDLPGLVGNGLGVKVREEGKVLSHHGGDSPAKLLDEAARRVAIRESRVSIVCGGEALASLSACAAVGQVPPPNWTEEDESQPTVSLSERPSGTANIGSLHGIGLPIHIYPLYENALRHHRDQTVAANHAESAELYAQFANVAAGNPYAWNYGKPPKSAQEIGAVGGGNRMICFPYPLLLNAFNNVNLAAACIVTSTEYAKELGIPESKWIYPLGGAGTQDSADFWQRPDFHSSPAISASLDHALAISNLRPSDIDIYDFYSCFPIVPKLACLHLGLNIAQPEKPITVLGGLTSFGGAGNNYSLHAITEITRRLRSSSSSSSNDARNALVLANGGVLTYQHVICLSSTAPSSAYPTTSRLPQFTPGGKAPPPVATIGKTPREAVVETYTVSYARSGEVERGWVVGRVDGGERFVAVVEERGCLRELVGREGVGRRGWVRMEDEDGGRNIFGFEAEARL